VVIGSIAALLGAAMLAGGGAILWADQTQRDDGYLTSPRERFESSSYAIVSEPIDLVSSDPDVADWFLSDDVLGEVRLTVTGQNVFLGVGRSDDVDAYNPVLHPQRYGGVSGGGRGRGRPHPFQGGPQARDEVRCYSAELGRAQLGRALLDKPSPKKTAAKTKNTTPIPESSWVKS
jgi:hypothetical protein